MPFDGLIRPGSNGPRQFPQGRFELDPSHPLAAGLVGCWPLNGDARDYSLNGNNGTLVAAPSTVIGPMGPTLSFNGSSQYVSAPQTIADTSAATFCAWANVYAGTITPGSGNLIGRGSDNSGGGWSVGMGLGVGSNPFISIVTTSGGGAQYSAVASSISPVANKWYFLCGVWQPSSYLKLYVDGSLEANTAITTNTLRSSGVGIVIGAAQIDAVSPSYFNGSIDDVRIYNRALSAAEVAWLYAEPAAIFRPLARRSVRTITAGSSVARAVVRGVVRAVVRAVVRGR